MNIAVIEYASAGGYGSATFLEEGRAMLSALLKELSGISGICSSSIISAELPASEFPADELHVAEADLYQQLGKLFKKMDYAWIIAPEEDMLLHRLSALATESGTKLIGASAAEVLLFSDKLATYNATSRVIPQPETVIFNGDIPWKQTVVKPQFGAGCNSVYLLDAPLKHDIGSGFICQPYITGEPMSCMVIAFGNDVRIVGVSCQGLKVGGTIRLEYVEVVNRYPKMAELEQMVIKLHEVAGGLNGYFGVDFLDSENGLVFIELNPRLTSSYTAHRAAGLPIASELLKMMGIT